MVKLSSRSNSVNISPNTEEHELYESSHMSITFNRKCSSLYPVLILLMQCLTSLSALNESISPCSEILYPDLHLLLEATAKRAGSCRRPLVFSPSLDRCSPSASLARSPSPYRSLGRRRWCSGRQTEETRGSDQCDFTGGEYRCIHPIFSISIGSDTGIFSRIGVSVQIRYCAFTIVCYC